MTPFLDGALRWIYEAGPPKVCPACGFDWSIEPGDALIVIASSPDRFEAVLAGRNGMQSQPDGSWNATAYLWHLADLASSWTERWVQIRESPGSLLVGFDPDELADARGYRSLPTTPGLWALRSAVNTFFEVTTTLPMDTPFEHGDWGRGDVADGLRWLGHEFHHHEADVAARAV
ncbi:MAG: hypothetical protein ACR2N7_11875 [Acidimicrobiia bacterium]